MTQITKHPLFDQLQNAPTPAEKTRRLLQFMREAGQTHYDEVVTQLEHALQCAALADEAGADDRTVIGALLHDFGHFLQNEHAANGAFLKSDLMHEIVGADFLEHFFGPGVTEPIRHHVAAKRYLCAMDASYHDSLSAASQKSLQLQGGPLVAAELADMQKLPHLQSILEIRRWDDLAKSADKTVPGLETYEPRITSQWRR